MSTLLVHNLSSLSIQNYLSLPSHELPVFFSKHTANLVNFNYLTERYGNVKFSVIVRLINISVIGCIIVGVVIIINVFLCCLIINVILFYAALSLHMVHFVTANISISPYIQPHNYLHIFYLTRPIQTVSQ